MRKLAAHGSIFTTFLLICVLHLFADAEVDDGYDPFNDVGGTIHLGWPLRCIDLENENAASGSWEIDSGVYGRFAGLSLVNISWVNTTLNVATLLALAMVSTRLFVMAASLVRYQFSIRFYLALVAGVAVCLSIRWGPMLNGLYSYDNDLRLSYGMQIVLATESERIVDLMVCGIAFVPFYCREFFGCRESDNRHKEDDVSLMR